MNSSMSQAESFSSSREELLRTLKYLDENKGGFTIRQTQQLGAFLRGWTSEAATRLSTAREMVATSQDLAATQPEPQTRAENKHIETASRNSECPPDHQSPFTSSTPHHLNRRDTNNTLSSGPRLIESTNFYKQESFERPSAISQLSNKQTRRKSPAALKSPISSQDVPRTSSSASSSYCNDNLHPGARSVSAPTKPAILSRSDASAATDPSKPGNVVTQTAIGGISFDTKGKGKAKYKAAPSSASTVQRIEIGLTEDDSDTEIEGLQKEAQEARTVSGSASRAIKRSDKFDVIVMYQREKPPTHSLRNEHKFKVSFESIEKHSPVLAELIRNKLDGHLLDDNEDDLVYDPQNTRFEKKTRACKDVMVYFDAFLKSEVYGVGRKNAKVDKVRMRNAESLAENKKVLYMAAEGWLMFADTGKIADKKRFYERVNLRDIKAMGLFLGGAREKLEELMRVRPGGGSLPTTMPDLTPFRAVQAPQARKLRPEWMTDGLDRGSRWGP